MNRDPRAAIVFDDFEPGAILGETAEAFDPGLAESWQRIFGAPSPGASAMGAGIAVVLMMRAYLAVVAPRPPGNIHARQRFQLAGMPRPGERIRTVVTCAGKEMKRGRPHVELATEGTGEGGRPIYTGRMTLIWAA